MAAALRAAGYARVAVLAPHQVLAQSQAETGCEGLAPHQIRRPEDLGGYDALIVLEHFHEQLRRIWPILTAGSAKLALVGVHGVEAEIRHDGVDREGPTVISGPVAQNTEAEIETAAAVMRPSRRPRP